MKTTQLFRVSTIVLACATFAGGARAGTETTRDFAMNHSRTQGPLTDIIGRRDIGSIQKNEEVLAMFEVTPL